MPTFAIRMITPNGELKSWCNMTPEERQRDLLRHFPTLLARWRGGRGKLWELTVSVKRLVIRIERPGVYGNLHVTCLGPSHIHGPVEWNDSNLEVLLLDSGAFVVRDVVAGAEILAESVEIAENREPLYTPI